MNDIKVHIDKISAAAQRNIDINCKAQQAIVSKDFSLFTKEELATIAELSANRATVLTRELREYKRDLEVMVAYITDEQSCLRERIQQVGPS